MLSDYYKIHFITNLLRGILSKLSKELIYNCFSSPRGKWVPVRTEMVLVIDLAWCATYLAAQGAEIV